MRSFFDIPDWGSKMRFLLYNSKIMNALLLLALLLPSTHARDDSSVKRKLANSVNRTQTVTKPAAKKKSGVVTSTRPSIKPTAQPALAPKRAKIPVITPPPRPAPAPEPEPVAEEKAVEIKSTEQTESAVDLSSGAVVAEGEEVALDLGAEADSFNPYLFDRSPLWLLLPVMTLFLLGLHLLPVPRRGGNRKRMEADQFFSDLKQNQKSGPQPPQKGA